MNTSPLAVVANAKSMKESSISPNFALSALTDPAAPTVFPLVHFALMVFVADQTLFRWENTAMKFPVHPKLEMAELSSFSCVLFFVDDARERLIHKYTLSIPL